MDKLEQLKTKLPELVHWLGDRVQTVKGLATDEFLSHLQKNPRGSAELVRMFGSLLTKEGFDLGTIEVDGNRNWIIFKRLIQ